MNKKLTMIAAGIGLALSVPTVAAAAPWVPVGQRVANLNVRIDQGVRNGSLTRPEAMRLRTQLRDLQGLEARYRRGGLTIAERADLDRRFDRLSAQVRFEKHDRRARW
ncbi:hypothetical protein [Sphingomonas lycopersici]|uniref:Uncharacterized protein n=2 Tax=Sphingomonas TaxID=13687 RepID=A0AA41ZGN4_9SPHN|nr:hypothetical protein [Sphingomonas lycopersici]MCW6532379.1 hypothetical protein [Sphingomonas lycopersici]MCW6536574.1 hypothetical protein [Sphingomonas lycopersici]